MRGWMTRSLVLLALATLTSPRCEAQLTASLDDDNYLVLEASGLELLAVEFRSPSGSLIPSENPSPFQGVLLQDTALSLYYNLGTPFVLDGSIRLETQWDASMPSDIQFQYGTPDMNEELQTIVGHEVFSKQVSSNPIIVTELDGFTLAPEPATRFGMLFAMLAVISSHRHRR